MQYGDVKIRNEGKLINTLLCVLKMTKNILILKTII